MIQLFTIDPLDNVAVTFHDLKKDDLLTVNDLTFPAQNAVDRGHKVAVSPISKGQEIIKYGASIGIATKEIAQGEPVHVQNMKTNLSGRVEYTYRPKKTKLMVESFTDLPSLQLFKRQNGTAGIRNELWVVPTVGCVNSVAANIIAEFTKGRDLSGVDGVFSFPHPYGCSQLGGDHERTRKMLQNIAMHPNAGGVLVLGLGCENNQVKTFRETLPEQANIERFAFLEAQEVEDEIAAGVELLEQLYAKASRDVRTTGEWADLVIGLECGGSDAFSGITANPLIGKASDYLIAHGGTAVLTEVPEMFGAEHILMQQCNDQNVFEQTVAMVNEYKEYYESHNQPIYENPSPGNKRGGITTLEEKSLGCTRKAGSSSVVDVVRIDERIDKQGLNLLYSPGNDIVATTALGAAGCQLVLFSTGRGTPLGGFIPTIKIASTSALAQKKANWIDFNSGVLTEQEASQEDVLKQFLKKIILIVNGAMTSAEERNSREIAIFKTGVTL